MGQFSVQISGVSGSVLDAIQQRNEVLRLYHSFHTDCSLDKRKIENQLTA